MKMKIDSRDIKFFLLGLFTMFLIVLIYDWDSFVKGFNSGMNDQENIPNIETSK